MASNNCRAKDPTQCRHHGNPESGFLSKIKDAILNRNFNDYASHRGQMEEANKLDFTDAENAFLANYGGEWTVQSMSERERTFLTMKEWGYLQKAAPHMKDGEVTPEAIEAYAREAAYEKRELLDSMEEGEREISLAAAKHVLTNTMKKKSDRSE